MRVGVTGHQEIPSAARAWVDDRLRELIAEWSLAIGVSSLAKGADQMFASCMLAAGHKLEAVIPCREYATTFDVAGLADYSELLGQAGTVVTLDFGQPSEDAFLAAGKYIVDNVELLIAIWDGEDAQGSGGTGDIVRYARSVNVPVSVVWLPGLGPHHSSN